jgi:hypothetical protein
MKSFMNREDPLFQALRRLPPVDLDPALAQRVRRLAMDDIGTAPRPMPFLPRVLAPAVLALLVAGYFTWSLCFVLAG